MKRAGPLPLRTLDRAMKEYEARRRASVDYIIRGRKQSLLEDWER